MPEPFNPSATRRCARSAGETIGFGFWRALVRTMKWSGSENKGASPATPGGVREVVWIMASSAPFERSSSTFSSLPDVSITRTGRPVRCWSRLANSWAKVWYNPSRLPAATRISGGSVSREVYQRVALTTSTVAAIPAVIR
jgi:hypothetical protein